MAADSAPEEEVRRLERHYSVNPEGLVFARLADAYRRCGRLERALDLLRDGLDRHPDYTTGHLIAGRTLREAGRASEAADAYRRVLELDAENLVALRSLAEIATERGEVEEARRWADRLQSADPFASLSVTDVRREAAVGGAPEDGTAVEGDGEPGADREEPAESGRELPGEEDLAGEVAALADEQWWGSSAESSGGDGDGSEVATETMASLYAQQGLHAEAAEVYRRLLERRPDDEQLQARLSEMERRARGGAGESGGGAQSGDDTPERDREEAGGDRREGPTDGDVAVAGEGGSRASDGAVTAREHFRALLRGRAERPAADRRFPPEASEGGPPDEPGDASGGGTGSSGQRREAAGEGAR